MSNPVLEPLSASGSNPGVDLLEALQAGVHGRWRVSAEGLAKRCFELLDSIEESKLELAPDKAWLCLVAQARLPNESRLAMQGRMLGLGARIDVLDSGGYSLAMHSCASQDEELLRWCLLNGSDPMAKHSSGRSILSIAAASLWGPGLCLLLGAGADVAAIDGRGSSAWDYLLRSRPWEGDHERMGLFEDCHSILSAALEARDLASQVPCPSEEPQSSKAVPRL